MENEEGSYNSFVLLNSTNSSDSYIFKIYEVLGVLDTIDSSVSEEVQTDNSPLPFIQEDINSTNNKN